MNLNEDWRNFATICRLCMQRDGFMLGIFNHKHGKERSIYKKIMDCTTLEISSEDGLPNSICHRCLYKVDFCLEFRQQCYLSDATLRNLNALPKEVRASIQPTFHENNVVMVVDPSVVDYNSEYDSDNAAASKTTVPAPPDPAASDLEPQDAIDQFEYKNVHMCKYCDRAFSDKTECNTHETEDHNKDAPYKCSVCYQCFPDRNQYSGHLKSEHLNDKPYTCPECDRCFARRSDLRKHTIVHTGIKPFTCPICGKSFSRNTNLSKHIRIHKSHKPFVCHSCPRTFMSKMALNRHEVQHTGVKPFKCNYCQMGFMRKDKMLRHRKRHLPKEGTQEAFRELQALRENLMSEYGMPSFNNDTVAAMGTDGNPAGDSGIVREDSSKDTWPSANPENLVVNIDPFNNGHGTEVEPVCVTPDILNSPVMEDSSPYSNDNKAYGTSETFDCIDSNECNSNDAHQADEYEEQQDIKNVTCLMCPMKFSSEDNLQQHMGFHSGERPFGCNICGRAFSKKRELDRHYTMHTGIKLFECKLCKKRFSRKDKLLRHSRIHEVSKLECEICGATFNRKDGLAQHMKSHIKDEVDIIGC